MAEHDIRRQLGIAEKVGLLSPQDQASQLIAFETWKKTRVILQDGIDHTIDLTDSLRLLGYID